MQREVLSYFAILNVAVGLGSPLDIVQIPIWLFLKGSLHLSPMRLAVFLAIASTPVCLGFVFGFKKGPIEGARDGEIANTCWSAQWPPPECIFC